MLHNVPSKCVCNCNVRSAFQMNMKNQSMIRGLTLICKVEAWVDLEGGIRINNPTTGNGSLGHFLSEDIQGILVNGQST